MSPSLADQTIRVMAMKYAQRRTVSDIALEVGQDQRLILSELRMLERSGSVRRWTDGGWGLTSQGNMRRNELVS